ncbi:MULTISPECIES: saccharopine dehydrogenase family protein [unclassified Mycobacterium]|uniref:saccharopine dehydrogenase family protein n=1 Tax=unclassified Mycobacterium TaxID=2642494 RepID=UPI0029C69DB4|nr:MULTISPECIES: saccharopine dehydrogenase NADP-binding domain-containing protein [unclassified Mycobacterium]
MTALMIYGATGYTGRMAAEHAAAAGLKPILAGRDGSRLAALADELGVDHRAFGLDDPSVVDESMSDVSVLLNCAGPYQKTAHPLMTAAIRSGSHYLDVAAELDGYRLAETLDDQARAAEVMLLPGSGGSVAMLGCLAGHAVERVSHPKRIRIALHVTGSMSRGSAISAAENLTTECLMMADGHLVSRDPGEVREFDFGTGPTTCSPVTLPDLVTIWRSTGVPDIETFVHVSGGGFPEGDLDALPAGPTDEQRDANRYHAAVEVTGADGRVVHSVLDTVNGYTFTPMAATEAARRVLGGEFRAGFHTPATIFGNGFVETIADSGVFDL